MQKIFCYTLFSALAFGQVYSANVYGFSLADIQLETKSGFLKLNYKTNGIIDFIWPTNNTYITKYDTTHYGLISFQKNIKQGTFTQKPLFELNDGLLKHKKEFRPRLDSTQTLFTMLAMIMNRPYELLDTQWFEVDHEGKSMLGRFLWSGTEEIKIGTKNIICNHFRLDLKGIDETGGFLTDTDRLMKYVSNPDGVRQIWVEQNGNHRIIRVEMNANGFPFEILIQ